MRLLTLAALALVIGLTSCNNGAKNSNASSDSAQEVQKMASTSNALPEVPADAKIFFKNLEDGQTVTSPFKVEMGVTGMSVDSSGTVKPGSGHHHLLIDAGDSIPKGEVVPSDSSHLHFGNAQTETTLNLPPGKHTLTLQFADGLHRSYGSEMATSITVNVKK